MSDKQDIARGLVTLQEGVAHLKKRVTDLEGKGDSENMRWALNRITDAEQNIEAIRADLAKCQSQVNDQSTDTLREAVEKLGDRLRKLRRAVMREDALTDDERCLVYMYRFIRDKEWQEGDTPMEVRATRTGGMAMVPERQ